MASAPVTRSRRREREESSEATLREDLPKRRKTIGSSADDSLSASSPSRTVAGAVEQEHLVRDRDFYRDDGDCILRLDDTLFKVHKHKLSPNDEESVFNGMFALPSGGGDVAEGKDDTNPIKLAGDTLDELRAFFEYAYASPRSLQFKNIPDADLQKLIDTTRFTHKYRLESFEDWAKDAITDITSRNKGRALKECSVETYISLLYLDDLCEIPALRDRVRGEWLARMRQGSLWTSLPQALEVSEALRFRQFQGDIYYVALQGLDRSADVVTGMAATNTVLPALGDLHNLRLLMGHRSLSMCWDRAIRGVPAFSKGLCKDEDCDCPALWRREWRSAVQYTLTVAPGMAFLARFYTLQENLSGARSLACKTSAYAATHTVQRMINSLNHSLADHFLGPEPDLAAQGEA
ncbi:hypothetical protein B0H10DRAFT_1904924 [Mycena sp. CBHHK59/15]|nr:hypothetical protein B0H10DRAFT_1904924 [Mycena sp. CBHHK59/15]